MATARQRLRAAPGPGLVLRQSERGCPRGPEDLVVRGAGALDEVLDDVMLYWLPNTGASAARMYWEAAQTGWSSPGTIEEPLTVPVGLSIMPGEYVRRSRRWAERRYTDLVFFNEVARGGHFAALEQPDLLVADIRATFRGLR